MKKDSYSLADFGVTRREGVLSNGLRVVCIEKPFAPINAKIMMRAGAVFDPVGKEGLAHFTEHVVASGSKELSIEAFSGLLESVGGYWNATTGSEYMSVECEVALPEHMDNMRQYFQHALSSVHLTEELLTKEKGVVISEVEKARSKPDYNSYWHIAKVVAGDTPWGRPVLGIPETVSRFSIQDVETFFQTYCVVENMVLVVAGGCTWDLLEQTFATIPLQHGKLHELPDDPRVLESAAPILYEQNVPQTNIAVMFQGPQIGNREDHLFNFALRIAHDGFTSRFYKKIRNERGLAYSLGKLGMTFKEHTQYLGTQLGVPEGKVPEALAAVKECYQELLEEGISQKEIDDKVDTMWFAARRSMERASDWVEVFDYDELYPPQNPLYGTYPDVYNYRRTYTAAEVHAVLKKYITLDKVYLALAGKGVEKYTIM